MPFAYYKRLPARARRIYDRSNEVSFVRLPAPERLEPLVAALARALQQSDRPATEVAASRLTAEILAALRVSGLRLRVLAKRPSHSWGELHGLYEPEEGKKPLVTVWMRTAQRKQVVAFKTFLRTLLHEIGHHLDYELLELEDSLHTEGFYKRESSLFRQLVPEPSLYEERTGVAAPPPPAAVRPPAAAPVRKARRRSGAASDPPKLEQGRLPFTES